MDTSNECAGHVRILSLFDDFWQSYAPLTLKKKGNFQFPFIISSTVVHIQLKLKIWICHENTLVNFEFGHGLMIADRVIPLELRQKNLSIRSLYPLWVVHLTYRYILGISSSSLNLVVVQ
jgi:hypothetical protein